MSISEKTLVETEKMAIAEINAAGGINIDGESYEIKYVVEDGASNWPLFAEKAGQMIDAGYPVIFGGWTSASRDAMEPVFESKKGFLY